MPAYPKAHNDVKILSPISPEFESLYLKVRKKENRLYSDPEVYELPDTFFYNLHRQEWELRRKSLERLQKYLKGREEPAKVLELGCGNGWLSAQIAKYPNYEVMGLDVNLKELEQACRVFDMSNLSFAYGDIFKDILPFESFDYIILSSTIQYFPNLSQLINRCRQFLKPGGEIHIMDSPLYAEKDIENAKKRSAIHYQAIGCPEMIDHYYHHPKTELAIFDYQYLYKPKRFFRKNDSPFPWVKIIN